MDEVIGATNDYGYGNRKKSLPFELNQSSAEYLTKGGGQLRRQLRVLAASFWRLASKVGGLVSKLPSASVKSLSIIGKMVGEGGPHFNGKGGMAVSQPLLYNKLPFAQHDHERRQRIA
ncbi:hypothetical protein PIB30_065584 [Stylosanthes scabra]|uniref:Uncharacterized protein n=1 Tax=Stylosanthes scabra TaxID=79078 RepID=A0ABU6WM22_9FABA|nr:hypothetical protein [Stylosanthes scabra]